MPLSTGPVKDAVIAASVAGDIELVALVAGKKIRVLNYTIIAAGDVVVRFESGPGGTALTGLLTLTASSGAAPNGGDHGLFETASGAALSLELASSIVIGGHLSYQEIS
jgi:hypothetical protein